MIWIVLGISVLLVMFVIGIYNGLITARNGYQNAFAQIDVQLKRRYDLIPNLVETAKGYLKHERETLEAVIAARNSAQSAARSAAATTRRRAKSGRRRCASPRWRAHRTGRTGSTSTRSRSSRRS